MTYLKHLNVYINQDTQPEIINTTCDRICLRLARFKLRYRLDQYNCGKNMYNAHTVCINQILRLFMRNSSKRFHDLRDNFTRVL